MRPNGPKPITRSISTSMVSNRRLSPDPDSDELLIYLRFAKTIFMFRSTIFCFRFTKAKRDALSPLLKFFPSRAGTPAGKIFFPNSPCPSPTPIFQQLYMALAQYERLPPDVVGLLPDDEWVMQKSNSFSNIASEAQSPSTVRRRSYPLGNPSVRMNHENDKS